MSLFLSFFWLTLTLLLVYTSTFLHDYYGLISMILCYFIELYWLLTKTLVGKPHPDVSLYRWIKGGCKGGLCL